MVILKAVIILFAIIIVTAVLCLLIEGKKEDRERGYE